MSHPRVGVTISATAAVVMIAVPAFAAPPDGALVDRTIIDVLSDQDFDGLRKGLFERLRDRAIAFILEQFGSLFGGSATSVVALIVLGIAVLAMVLVAYRVVSRRVVLSGPDGNGVDVVVKRGAGEWWSAAKQARVDGDLGEAARLGYRAVLATLDARGLVDDVDGATVGEHRRQLAGTDAADNLGGFDTAAGTFERAWYGGQELDAADLAAVDEAARRIGVDGA